MRRGCPAPCRPAQQLEPQLQALRPRARLPGSALPHTLSCTEMRLSLPSSWVTGWHPCKVSCTGAMEWGGTGDSSMSSTGSFLCSIHITLGEPRREVTLQYLRIALPSEGAPFPPNTSPFPFPKGRVRADSMETSCPLLATQGVSRSFQSGSPQIQGAAPSSPWPVTGHQGPRDTVSRVLNARKCQILPMVPGLLCGEMSSGADRGCWCRGVNGRRGPCSPALVPSPTRHRSRP